MNKLNNNVLNIYCDGGARGNPGPAACAFIVYNYLKSRVYSQGSFIGVTTNNIAEYHGVLEAMVWLQQNPSVLKNIKQVNFYLDSLLVVNQLKGLYKVKDLNLQVLFNKIILIKNKISKIYISFNYIPRSQNFSADLLVNQSIDASV